MATGDPIIFNSICAQPKWGTINSSFLEPSYETEKQLMAIQERMTKIEERLAIIRPDRALQEKYPALKEAYEHYKLIEKLVRDQNGSQT
jgi:hypothetical protein